jgi:hypothetical protein
MNFINSQYITAKMTHLTPEDGYQGMKKNGIKLIDRGDGALLYKPPGFWISLDGGWEEWCIGEEFRDVQNETICDVYLKPNLLFLRISTVDDANELFSFLIPELHNHRILDHTFLGIDFPLSDLMIISNYQIHELQKGNPVTAKSVWRKALESCDGIYYENSGDLHFHTIFNTWDCSSVMLFDPRNANIIKQS